MQDLFLCIYSFQKKKKKEKDIENDENDVWSGNGVEEIILFVESERRKTFLLSNMELLQMKFPSTRSIYNVSEWILSSKIIVLQ